MTNALLRATACSLTAVARPYVLVRTSLTDFPHLLTLILALHLLTSFLAACSLNRLLSIKRALQLQAEEAFMSPLPYRTASIANESDPIIEPSDVGRSNRGRARAGTLPSSWGDNLPNLQPPSFQEHQSAYLQTRLTLTVESQNAPPHDLTRVGSASQLPTSNGIEPIGGAGLAPPPSSQRLRSGSLTLPTANLANAFGPSFFSSHWQPTRSVSYTHLTLPTIYSV